MKVAAYLAMSLDGFIAKRNHDLKWMELVHREDEDYGYSDFFESVDGIFIGRNTYDKVLEFGKWPYEGKKVFVRTNHSLGGDSRDVTVLQGELRENLGLIESHGVRKLYLDGGQLISDAIKIRRLNELTISILPIILGDGIRLFGQLPDSSVLQLRKSKAYSSGLVQNTYVL